MEAKIGVCVCVCVCSFRDGHPSQRGDKDDGSDNGAVPPDGIRQLLEDQLLHTLNQYVINNIHLEATVRGIVYDLSAPPIAFRNEPGETCIREAVVLPLLSAIFERALPLRSEGTAEGYTVQILPEDPVGLHDGRPRDRLSGVFGRRRGRPRLPPRHRGQEEAHGEAVTAIIHVRG